MAAELKKIGIDAEIVVGNSGEFTVWSGGQKIAEKQGGRFPTPSEVIGAVRSSRTSDDH